MCRYCFLPTFSPPVKLFSSRLCSYSTLVVPPLSFVPLSQHARRLPVSLRGWFFPFFFKNQPPLLPSPPRRSVPVYHVLYSATMAAPPHTWSLVCAFLYFIQSLSRDPVNSSFLTKMRFVFVICLHMYIIQKCMTILYASPGASVHPVSQRSTGRRVKII